MEAAKMKTPGQIAYEADVKKVPVYHDGTPRKKWDQLPEVARRSWESIESWKFRLGVK